MSRSSGYTQTGPKPRGGRRKLEGCGQRPGDIMLMKLSVAVAKMKVCGGKEINGETVGRGSYIGDIH